MGESNFLGNQNGVRRLRKDNVKENGNVFPKPSTSKVNDGRETPYEPQNNGLRVRMGLPVLPNGTGED